MKADRARVLPTEEELSVRDMNNYVEQVASGFERLAAEIRRLHDWHLSIAGTRGAMGVHTYGESAAAIVKAINDAAFNSRISNLVESAARADVAHTAASASPTGPVVHIGQTLSEVARELGVDPGDAR